VPTGLPSRCRCRIDSSLCGFPMPCNSGLLGLAAELDNACKKQHIAQYCLISIKEWISRLPSRAQGMYLRSNHLTSDFPGTAGMEWGERLV
jgi:hypothetical protein